MTPLKSMEVIWLQQRSGYDPKYVVLFFFKATIVNCICFFFFSPPSSLHFQPPSNLIFHSLLGGISKLNRNNLPFPTLNNLLAAVHSDILRIVFLIMVSNSLNNVSCKKEIQLPLELLGYQLPLLLDGFSSLLHSKIQTELYV